MEIIPGIQFIIILSLSAVLLVIVASVTFYKLGKKSKEKIKGNESLKENNVIAPVTNPVKEPLKAAGDKRKKSEISIIDGNEIKLYQHKKEKMITPSELYAKEIEEEASSKERKTIKENKTIDSKFLKYTSEGYKPAKGDKEKRTLGWR